MAWHEQAGLFARLTDIFYFFVFLSWAGGQMENRSFLFLCFLKKHHWERKCQHSSLQLANNERQSSGNQELSTSSEHLAGVCYGQTKPQGFGDHLVTRGDMWDTLLQVTKTHACACAHTHTHKLSSQHQAGPASLCECWSLGRTSGHTGQLLPHIRWDLYASTEADGRWGGLWPMPGECYLSGCWVRMHQPLSYPEQTCSSGWEPVPGDFLDVF